MDNLLPENETVEVEGRRYLNPNLVIDETNTFIDKLRGTQGMNTQEIATQTEMLGTDIPSSQGGLMGANSYFTSRYQTPQTNSAVANLRRVAQESALNQALANEQAMWKKRYDEAYRRYQRIQNDKTNDNPSTTTPDNISTGDTTQEITSIETEALAKSRYQKLLMKYLQAGYPVSEAETKAKEDFGKSISVDAPVEPYGGQ